MSENLGLISAFFGVAGSATAAAFIKSSQDNLFSHLTPRSRILTLFAATVPAAYAINAAFHFGIREYANRFASVKAKATLQTDRLRNTFIAIGASLAADGIALVWFPEWYGYVVGGEGKAIAASWLAFGAGVHSLIAAFF